jgi:hypothetical protein
MKEISTLFFLSIQKVMLHLEEIDFGDIIDGHYVHISVYESCQGTLSNVNSNFT